MQPLSTTQQTVSAVKVIPDRLESGRWAESIERVTHVGMASSAPPRDLDISLSLFTDPESRISVAGRARLDQRAILAGSLGLDDDVDSMEIIARAYMKWGERFVERLVGDFAFIVVDGANRKILGFRDHFGQIPAYYCAGRDALCFSVHIEGIVECFSEPLHHNEAYIASNLVVHGRAPGQTVYKEIQLLPPRSRFLYCRGELSLTEYWRLEPGADSGIGDEATAVGRLRELLEEAVREQATGAARLGAEISGGIDSSGVAAVLQRLLVKEGRSLVGFSNALPSADRTRYPGFVDESDKIEAAVSHCGIRNHHVIDRSVADLETMFGSFLSAFGQPSNFSLHLYQSSLAERARRSGIDVLFSGFGGDECVSETATSRYAACLARSGKMSQLFEYNLQRSGVGKALLRTGKGIFDTLARREERIARRVRIRDLAGILLKDEIVAEYGFKERPVYFPVGQSIRERSLFRLFTNGTQERLQTGYWLSRAYGFEYRYPLLYKPLVEFYFGLSDRMKGLQPNSRNLYRKAIADSLPAWVVDQVKPNNTVVIPYKLGEIEAEFGFMADCCLALSRHHELFDYLSRAKLEAFVQRGKGTVNPYSFQILQNCYMHALFFERARLARAR